MIEDTNINIDGHVKIWDPTTQEVFVDKHNAINPETMSIIVANQLAGNNGKYVFEMHFGNGGIVIDETGNITYKDVTVNLNNGTVASLFSPTYFKLLDSTDTRNTDSQKNKIEVAHTLGLSYSDLIITCTLDREEPSASDLGNLVNVDQQAMDTAADFAGEFVFNEIGLKSKGSELNNGYLLSHIVFHPVQKSANRTIQVVYTLRIRIT
jgi:hypothetical protein